MELSLYLAKSWGIFIILICSALLIRRKDFKKMLRDINDGELYFLYGGIMALLIGVPHIIGHNVWAYDWRVIVTLLGWASLIKGIVLLFVPNLGIKFSKSMVISKFYDLALSIYLIIGVYLSYVGFRG